MKNGVRSSGRGRYLVFMEGGTGSATSHVRTCTGGSNVRIIRAIFGASGGTIRQLECCVRESTVVYILMESIMSVSVRLGRVGTMVALTTRRKVDVGTRDENCRPTLVSFR